MKNMIRVVCEVRRAEAQAIEVKEQIAMDLERYGTVRVERIDEVLPWLLRSRSRGRTGRKRTARRVQMKNDYGLSMTPEELKAALDSIVKTLADGDYRKLDIKAMLREQGDGI